MHMNLIKCAYKICSIQISLAAPKIACSDPCLELWHASEVSKPKLFSEVTTVFFVHGKMGSGDGKSSVA